MCGRYALRSEAEVLQSELDLVETPTRAAPRFNIAPTELVAIVPNRPPRRLVWVRWGLIPFWAKDPAIGNREINARAETLGRKPAYRDSFARRRCLVVADGFYEWRKDTLKTKTPFFIHRRSDKPFAFAGLWAVWRSPEGERVVSCSIVTTDANALLAPIHDRMPLILPHDAYDRWLDPEPRSPSELSPLLAPYVPDDLVTYPVTRRVNSPGPENDVPECIEPAPL